MARNTEKVENEKCTLVGPWICQKTLKLKKWETHTIGTGIRWETLKNMENDPHTL
jgi:hypothetical protein